MLNFLCFQQYKKVFLFLPLIAFPLLSAAQDCPPPSNALVIYDPYGDPWQAFVDWSTPSTECDILGYEIQYAFNDFIPGTGTAWDSLIVSGPISAIYIPGSANGLQVYIRTICAAPCGLMGDGDGNGNGASGWVLADIFIAPPPPPPCPGVDYEGNCSDPLEPGAMEDGCFPTSSLHFYGHCVQFNETVNPCTDEEEFMIWYQYDSPPTGELIFSGDIQDLSGTVTPPESFGIVVLDQNCNGNILDCDTTLTENDSLVVSLPPGETFFVGFWLNDAEYVIDPWEGDFSNYDLYLSVCEPEVDCAYPTDIYISDISDQSIEIEWDDGEGTSWMLEYGPPGFTPGTGTEVLIDTESPFLLEGLQPDTEYDFYMETICAQFGTNSINIGPTNFSTHPSMTIEPIPDGYFYCCDEIFLPESTEVEAFCDSIYFTHSDSIVGNTCPYTIHRTITAHDTCGNSIQTAFQYDILDNQIPCGCGAESIIPKDADEIRVALHGDWSVLGNGGIDEIYHLEDGVWTLHDTIGVNSASPKSLAIYDDVIVKTNRVYRLNGNVWSLETVLEPSIPGEYTVPGIVDVHENTIAYELNDMIFIFEYADGAWSEVATFAHNAWALELGEDILLAAVEFGDNIGRIYRKTGDSWALEQELPNYYPDNNGNGLGRDAAIDGNFAAIGYKYGGGLFTFKYNGNSWEPDEFLTNPYQVYPGGGYATSFGGAVDIEGDLMVVGDYFNAVNGNFSGSIAVFERSCGQWLPQRNIVPSGGEEDQRFGGCLDLQGSRMVVGVDNQYWLGGITYEGIGHYWFYECLESNPTFTITADNEVSVECMADVPPSELAYDLGNAWCSSAEVNIETDTVGTDCELAITRVFTATDSLGNTASATQLITISDTEPPVVVSAPGDVAFVCSADTDFEPPVFTDNCTDSVQVIFTADTVTNGCNTSIDQTWTATDDCGNGTAVSRTVTITDGPPEILSVPEDLNHACGDSWEMEEPVFTDDCTGELEISFSVDTVSMSCPLVVLHEWTATDDCGNSTVATRTITLTDTLSPELVSAPANLSMDCSEAEWEALPDPVFVDDCSEVITLERTTDTTSSECATVILYNWTAQDVCGNETSIERTITISDNAPPVVVDEPEDLTLLCTDNWTNETPDFTDNCDDELSIEVYVDTLLNDGCTLVMDYTWEATDNCGNSTTTQRTITISDEEPPVVNCPEEITVIVSPVDSIYMVPSVTEGASFSENCAELEITQIPSPGTVLTPENHEVVVSASDGCFVVECVVDVTVQFSTGIQEGAQTLVRIFPNPTNGMLNVQLPKTAIGKVDLFDITGKLVMHQEFNGREVLLNVNHLSKGIYALHIRTSDYLVVEKIVVE